MSEEKLKNPSGLTLHRTGYKFVLSWKPGNNYTDQQVKVVLRYGGNNWSTGAIKISENAKSYGYKLDHTSFLPIGDRKLKKITIYIRGKFRGKWTDWKSKDMDFDPPRLSKGDIDFMTVEYELVQRNKGTFSWGYGGETRPVTRLQYESILVQDCPDDYKSETLWKNPEFKDLTNSMSDSWTKAEDSGVIANKSYTRLFRIRACSFAGYSDWKYISHVYAAPQAAINVRGHVTLNKGANTQSLDMRWETPSDARHPIDEIIPQYLIDIPDADMTCPDSNNWVSRQAMADTSGEESDVFSIDEVIGYDKCLFVRVLTKHDGDNEITQSLPVMATGDSTGLLKAPTIDSVSLGENAVTIVATNTSDVEDSFLMMHYVDKNGNLVNLGRQVSGNVYAIPDLADKLPIVAAVKAVVGDNIMQSAMVYSAGSVPLAPSNLALDQSATVKNTVTVTWDWNWDDADACEISWSEHEDAWDSTDEPDTYIVTKAKKALLNISDVSAGVPLYVRARFIKGTEDEGMYSPYSDIASITISSVPQVPTLQVNKDIFVKDEPIVCSWVYVTNDGTEQIEAEIAEYVNGAFSDPPIAKVHEEQTVTLENNYATGTQHALAVRVCSGSRRWSEWSSLYVITVAEELECEITQTNLSYEDTEINPETYTGNPATFVGGDETNIKDITSVEVPLTPHQAGTPWQDSTIYQTPYLFRKTPSINHSINSKYTTLVGGSVVVNQLISNATFQNASADTRNYVSLRLAKGQDFVSLGQILQAGIVESIISPTFTGVSVIKHSGAALDIILANNLNIISGHKYLVHINFISADPTAVNGISTKGQTLIDLTQMLGSTIADYIYTLEQGTAGAGVAFCKKYGIGVGYTAYNAGTLQSTTPTKHTTVGFNQWDEETDIGDIDGITGEFKTGNYLKSKNLIPVLPSTAYYIKIPSTIILYEYDANGNGIVNNGNYAYHYISTSGTYTTDARTRYIAFRNDVSNPSQTYNHDICINLHWDGERDGEYEPYTKHEYDLGNDTLRGAFELNNGELKAKGDVKTADGTITRKYGQVDLGTLTWQYEPNYGGFFYTTGINSSLIKDRTKRAIDIFVCSKYVGSTKTGAMADSNMQNVPDKTVSYHYAGANAYVYVKDSAYTDADVFTSAMSGVYLTYELATSTEEEGTAFQSPQIVSNWGTEEYTEANNVPVGNETRYADVYEITGTSSVDTHLRGTNLVDTTNATSGLCGHQAGDTIDTVVASTRYSHSEPVLAENGLAISYLSTNTNTFAALVIEGFNEQGNWVSALILSAPTSTLQTYILAANTYKWVRIVYGAVGGQVVGTDITGQVQVQFGNQATAYEPYAGSDTTTALGQTVYEGTVDVVSGKLMITHVIFDPSTRNWTYYGGAGNEYFYASLPTHAKPKEYTFYLNDAIMNWYTQAGYDAVNGNNGTFGINAQGTYLKICDLMYDDTTIFKNAMTGAQLVYEIAEPIIVDLTPTDIQALLGDNYVWSEQGTVTVRIADAVESGYKLKRLPLTIKVVGAKEGNTTLKILRDEPYRIDRPDGEDFRGYLDEAVYSNEYYGEDTQSIDLTDLIQNARLDDGAMYRIEASVRDTLKQSATAEPIHFVVDWEKQAVIPNGTVEIEDGIAKITPISTTGAHEDDYIDIFRLSTDTPKLVYSGAHYGETIVDPYPTIGENGGYLLVLNTVYGDSITEDNRLAWTYLDAPFDSKKDLIDFNGERIELFYNVDKSHSWNKDSRVTKYLGGTVVVDYKKGVMRTGAVSAVAITVIDNDMIMAMRRMLNYQGPVHIRTRDGSSFTADIQGSQDYTHDTAGNVTSFSCNVTACKSVGLEGMTLGEWENELE